MVRRTALIAIVTTFAACGSCFDPNSVMLQAGDADTVTDAGDSGTEEPLDMGGTDGGDDPDMAVSDAGPTDMSATDMGSDMDAVDMSMTDMGGDTDVTDMSGVPDMAADMDTIDMPADMGTDACVPDTAATLCAAASAECDDITVTDNCGTARTVSCGTCGANSTCQSNACACDDGYELSTSTCVDIDECQRGTDTCDSNADCLNEPGTFDCECLDPYVGDGFTCIDPCGDGTCDIQGGETYENCAIDCSAAIDVTAGLTHSCAVLVDGSVRCWGNGIDGQLGHGSFTGSLIPVKALVSGPAVEVAAAFDGTCAALANGTVECWGQGDDGELGDGTTTATVATPVAVSNLTSVDHIDGGDDFFCAWQDNGDAWCWGLNSNDKLGIGVIDGFRSTPTQMVLSVNVKDFSIGEEHGCLVDTTDVVWCWGRDTDGEVGNGVGTADVAVAQDIGLGSIARVGMGGNHSCAVTTTGALECWGLNSAGQLGDQTVISSNVPIPVSGVTTASVVAGGTEFTCMVKTGGGVECWGEGTDGQLGNAQFVTTGIRQDVFGLSDAVDIDLGDDHACALRATGDVVCWGQGTQGQLGNGTNTDASVPQDVAPW